MVCLGRAVRPRDDPPVRVHLMMGHAAVPEADELLVGPEDEELLVADGLENLFVPGDCRLVVLGGDAHLGVIDHVGGLGDLWWNSKLNSQRLDFSLGVGTKR